MAIWYYFELLHKIFPLGWKVERRGGPNVADHNRDDSIPLQSDCKVVVSLCPHYTSLSIIFLVLCILLLHLASLSVLRQP